MIIVILRHCLPLAIVCCFAGSAYAESPWVELVSDQGPVGLAEYSDKITLCGDVELDAETKRLSATPGQGVIAVTSKLNYGDDYNLNSKQEFGDCEVQLEFLIGKGSNSGVKLQQRYEIQLYDSHHKEKPTARECGGIYPHWVFRPAGKGLKYIDEGFPPLLNAAKPAGEWQTLKIVFKAPRFDSENKKTENARFVLVSLNGETVQEDIEVDSPTGNASNPLPEVAEAPLFLQLDHGPVAFRNVRVKPLEL